MTISSLTNGDSTLCTCLFGTLGGVGKLFVFANGNEEMYNLSLDPYEENDLLLGTLNTMQQTAKTELENELLEIRQ